MATIGQAAMTQCAAIAVSRAADNTFVFRWRERNIETGALADAAVAGLVFTLTVTSADGASVWLTKTVSGLSAPGLVPVLISRSDLAAAVWAGRQLGRYQLTTVRGGRTLLLAADLIRID